MSVMYLLGSIGTIDSSLVVLTRYRVTCTHITSDSGAGSEWVAVAGTCFLDTKVFICF
jgi:hypothetical protein